jgi:hypothetical protein
MGNHPFWVIRCTIPLTLLSPEQFFIENTAFEADESEDSVNNTQKTNLSYYGEEYIIVVVLGTVLTTKRWIEKRGVQLRF